MGASGASRKSYLIWYCICVLNFQLFHCLTGNRRLFDPLYRQKRQNVLSDYERDNLERYFPQVDASTNYVHGVAQRYAPYEWPKWYVWHMLEWNAPQLRVASKSNVRLLGAGATGVGQPFGGYAPAFN
uniref:Uncharacterized protein n=1 Tax=Romanomermis culicivorax TaxID=13658 RepID=A0A915JVU7_ROMCU